MTTTTTEEMYVYDLPYKELKQLCQILDQNDKWEELGGTFMQFEFGKIQDIRRGIYRGQSPTEELLTMWGHFNHTVLELFILLSRMQHYQSMSILKPFVDTKYHQLIHEGEHNLTNLIRQIKLSKNRNGQHGAKDLGVARENFQVETTQKILNAPPQPELVSSDENESVVDHENNAPVTVRVQTKISNVSTVSESAGAVPQIPYEELQSATNNWDTNTILGRGGFGIVFKGIWKCTLVAIKRIEQRTDSPESQSIQLKQSITELHCLNVYRHDNVLSLYGYSVSGPQPCLVYQYMAGGCLEQRLRAFTNKQPKWKGPLNWQHRLNISKGVARGLQFLHTIGAKPLIHGDIKSANILLDLNDEPRIGDFGLAREGPQAKYTHMKVSRIHGTRPYLPDEFLRAKILSTKVDTYSFGVVLFEIATGLCAYSDNRPAKFLKDHIVNFEDDIIEFKDARAGDECEQYFYHFIDIGKMCVSRIPKDRPDMKTVLLQLEAVAI